MRRSLPHFFSLLSVAVLLSLSLPGCGGSSRADVTGQVTYNGKPLANTGGTISFLGADGIPVAATIDNNGNYQAKGVCVGENKVAVSYLRNTGQTGKRAPDAKGGPPVTDQSDSPFLTPASYAMPETSNLKVVVEKNVVYNPELNGPDIK
jgi:hypothetical protein